MRKEKPRTAAPSIPSALHGTQGLIIPRELMSFSLVSEGRQLNTAMFRGGMLSRVLFMQLYVSDQIIKVEDMRDVHGVVVGRWGERAGRSALAPTLEAQL